MTFLRALLPSWNFFDQVAPKATLYYKLTSANHWEPCLKAPKRKFLNLFLNPFGNLYLAQQSVVERLIYDIHQAGQTKAENSISDTVSYQLVLNIIRWHLKKSRVKKARFQFKISIYAPTETYDAIVSTEHEL